MLFDHTDREDDAILSFSSLVSLFFHGLLVILILVPLQKVAAVVPTEHVFITRFTQFSSVESFAAYSGTQKIFSDQKTGQPQITSGGAATSQPRLAKGEAVPITHGPQVPDLKRYVAVPPIRSASTAMASRSSSRSEYELPLTDAFVTTRRAQDAPSRSALPATTKRMNLQTGPNADVSVPTGASSNGRAIGKAERAAQYSGVVGEDRNFFSAPASKTRQGEGEGPSTAASSSSRQISDAVATGPSSAAGGRKTSTGTGPSPQSAGPAATGRPIPASVSVKPPEFQVSSNSKKGDRRLIQHILPKIPDWVEESGHDYFAQIKIHVNQRGEVTNAVIYQTSGQPELDQLAKRAVRQWLYEPRAGQENDYVVRVNFLTK